MHWACLTVCNFLSKEQIAVCLHKNKELHLRIFSYFTVNMGFLIISLHKLNLFLEFGLLITYPLHNSKTALSNTPQSGGQCLFSKKTRTASQLLYQAQDCPDRVWTLRGHMSLVGWIQMMAASGSLSPQLPFPCTQGRLLCLFQCSWPIFQPDVNYYKG